MKFKKQISSIVVSTMLVLGSMNLSYADGTNVVTLGANLSESQKQQMLNYFGVKKDQVLVLDVTNAEERQYLQGVATEGQLGKLLSLAHTLNLLKKEMELMLKQQT